MMSFFIWVLLFLELGVFGKRFRWRVPRFLCRILVLVWEIVVIDLNSDVARER